MKTGKLNRIGFLGFDGVSALDLTGPLEAFWKARTLEGQPCYEIVIVGLTGRRFVSDSGIVFSAKSTIETAAHLDTIVVPGGIGLHSETLGRILSAWLAAQADRPRRFVAVSNGIYPLAAAGLLDGRCVTTHWRSTQNLARRFPRLQVSATASFLQDGPYYTCGDSKAGVEMAIYLIKEDFGSQIALTVARDLVMDLRPPGDHEPRVQLSEYVSGPADRVAALPVWIAGRLQQELSVEVLAERSGLCRRHFSRLFTRIFSSSPADFVEQMRLSEGRRRLLMSHHTVESVGRSIGYKSADAFRRAFERRFGLTPNRYRRRFYFRVTNVAAVRANLITQRGAQACSTQS